MNSFLDGLSRTERVDEFCTLLQYPEVQEVLENIIETSLHNCNIFMRLNLIEEHLGADKFHYIVRDLDYKEGDSECDEERYPVDTIREQVNQIYKAIDSIPLSGEPVIIAGNVTEIRARLLIEKLESVNPRPNQFGIKYLTSTEVGNFLRTEIAEEFQYKGKGREVRTELMEKLYDKNIKTKI